MLLLQNPSSTRDIKGSLIFFLLPPLFSFLLCWKTHEMNPRPDGTWMQQNNQLKIVDMNLSYVNLHIKFNRSTPKISSLNLFHAVKTSPEEVQSVTLNDRRNTRLSFLKANNYKVGLNLVKNRLHSVTNVVDKKWID